MLAQRSGDAAVWGKPFKPGQSGNPGGKTMGLAKLIKKQTKDGKEIVAFMLGVMRGEGRPPWKQRVDAAMWLGDHVFGKAPQEITGESGGPLIVTLKLGDREPT
jgi:hypothetical protein